MTNEQILEELRKLKSHNLTPTSEGQANIETEVEEIDASIDDYNERIAELEEKLADSNNYAYNDENEERTFTVELLQESFENQLEVMDREDAEYRSLQELATNIFADYNNEIASLNVEIEAIERRIRKNEVAVRKNIGIKLTEEELADLNSELAEKKARVATCEEMKEKYVADLSNYGELLTANNRKRELVTGKQNSLNRIVENRKNNPITVNKHQLRLDQDELSRLKAGVKALESRKEYITYNSNAEIDKLISAISIGKGINEEDIEFENKKQNLFNTYTEMMNDDPIFSEQSIPELEENSQVDAFDNTDFVADTLETNDKEENTIVVPPMYSEFEDISSHSGNEDSVSEEEKEEDEVIDLIAAPSDLDELREAEIEDAKEELKEKKKDKKFVALWNKFSKRAKKIAAAAVAVGLTGVLILSLKSCNGNKTKQSDDIINTTPTTTYTQVEEAEKEVEDKTQTTSPTKPSNKDEVNTTKKPTTSTSTTQPTTSTTTTVKPTTPSTQPTTTKPTEPTVEKETETVELEKGEKVASFDDILNGNLSSDTIISHGDEVGKTIDGAEVKDYTEEGNMEVELEKKDEETKETVSSKTPEEIKKALEEFMGGEITFDHEGNQWLDEIQSGKTR